MGLYWDDPTWSWDDPIHWDQSPGFAGGTEAWPLTPGENPIPRRKGGRSLFWN